MRTLVNSVILKLEPEIPYNPDAENLIYGTIAQESQNGKYRVQLGGGPAKGICQMEPNTFNDIVNNYLKYHPAIADKIKQIAKISEFSPDYLVNNDALSICMCRVHYLRVNEKIPSTIEGYARYWKQYYNTPKGKGTEQEFIQHYGQFVR